jgi:hypothetical protein
MSSNPPSRGGMLRRIVPTMGLCLCIGLWSCEWMTPEAPAAPGGMAATSRLTTEDLDYRLHYGELVLAQAGRPYLVVDLRNHALELRLEGAVVWEYPMEFAEAESTSLREFSRRFQGFKGRVIRPLAGKYLFESAEKTSDSVLAIVGRAVNVDPELLQREVPERFQLQWDNNLILDICTTASGEPVSSFANAVVEIRQTILRPLGAITIVLQMAPEAALSLYRVAQPGMPTMILPEPSNL